MHFDLFINKIKFISPFDRQSQIEPGIKRWIYLVKQKGHGYLDVEGGFKYGKSMNAVLYGIHNGCSSLQFEFKIVEVCVILQLKNAEKMIF